MEVAIAGGHGKIAMALGRLLVGEGDLAFGLIRNPDQEDDLHEIAVEPVLCDLEGDCDVAGAVRGMDAIVYAAGAGAGSGAERKQTMDLGGALKLIEAARQEGVRRFLMVSAMGAADPPAEGGDVFGDYLRAKAAADEALRQSDLEYTIVRPGKLTDELPTGRVKVGERLDSGEIPRADVASVLFALLRARHSIDREFDLVGGREPIADAVSGL